MHSNLLSVDDHDIIGGMRERGAAADPAECTVDRTLARLDENEIESAVVWKIGRNSEQCRRNNDFVTDAVAPHRDRFIPFATVFPTDVDEALKELDRAILELGMAGVKVHPTVMDFRLDLPQVIAVVERAKELDVPFVTHVNPARAIDVSASPGSGSDHPSGDAIADYPRTANAEADRMRGIISAYDSPRFQSAHMGGVTLQWIRESNITFQTAGASAQVIQWAVDNVGSNRIVFGSDFPFFTVEDELAKVQELDAPIDAKTKILSGNALTRVLRNVRSPSSSTTSEAR